MIDIHNSKGSPVRFPQDFHLGTSPKGPLPPNRHQKLIPPRVKVMKNALGMIKLEQHKVNFIQKSRCNLQCYSTCCCCCCCCCGCCCCCCCRCGCYILHYHESMRTVYLIHFNKEIPTSVCTSLLRVLPHSIIARQPSDSQSD